MPHLQAYADAAAESLEDLADYLDRNEVGDIIEDVGSFAKRQPVVAAAFDARRRHRPDPSRPQLATNTPARATSSRRRGGARAPMEEAATRMARGRNHTVTDRVSDDSITGLIGEAINDAQGMDGG